MEMVAAKDVALSFLVDKVRPLQSEDEGEPFELKRKDFSKTAIFKI